MKAAIVAFLITAVAGVGYILYHYLALQQLEDTGVVDSNKAVGIRNGLSHGFLLVVILAVVVGVVTFIIAKIIKTEKLKV